MTALDRRLQKMEEALSPTEAATLWLISAKEHGSFRAYRDWVHEHPGATPMATIPRQVAAWAGHQSADPRERHQVSERTDQAVRAALSRVFLVEQICLMLQGVRFANEREGELLLVFAPITLKGKAGAEATMRWAEQVGRLLMETVGWQETLIAIGNRYFAGHPPIFPEDEDHLAWARTVCEHLVGEALAAQKAGRVGKAVRIDARKAEAEGRASVEPNIEVLRKIAQVETELFLGERQGRFRMRELIP